MFPGGPRLERILRESVIDDCGQIIRRTHLQHDLRIVTLAIDVGEIVTRVLRHLIDISRPRTIFDRGIRVHRQ